MIIKLTITAQSHTSLLKAVEAAETQLDAVIEQWEATLRFSAFEDCTPYDLAGVMRGIEAVQVLIEGALER